MTKEFLAHIMLNTFKTNWYRTTGQKQILQSINSKINQLEYGKILSLSEIHQLLGDHFTIDPQLICLKETKPKLASFLEKSQILKYLILKYRTQLCL